MYSNKHIVHYHGIYFLVAPISGPVEGGECTSTQVYAAATTCDAYLLCVSGTWRKQMCPPGLHWDKRSNRCDWVQFAMCEGSFFNIIV